MFQRRPLAGFAIVLCVCAAIVTAIHFHARSLLVMAKQQFVEASRSEARAAAQRLDRSLGEIYESLRLLANLPSVRTIERHGENLSDEARTSFQHIYNNLATSVSVSEVYIVPATLDPDRIDPVTGLLEAPILMFDHLILNAASGVSRAQREINPDSVSKLEPQGPEEVEIYEYRVLHDHASWLMKEYPTLDRVKGLKFPLITSPEVITCDNTEFVHTGKDADRSGIVFSVPFYGVDNQLRGMVTATILTNALARLLDDSAYGLINPSIAFSVNRPGTAIPPEQRVQMLAGKPETRLIYSEVIPLSIDSSASQWSMWVARPDSDFYNSADARTIRTYEYSGYTITVLLAAFGSVCWLLILRNLANAERASEALRIARDEALAAESNSRGMAELFKSMNDDVIRLNVELAEKLRQLRDAQDAIIRQAKLSQLSELIGVVAHEIRNPLGAVRTSSYLIAKRVAKAGLGLDNALRRIDNGVARCDSLIAQLLDFARPQTPTLQPIELDAWLEVRLADAAARLPEAIDLRCELGLGNLHVPLDSGQMGRVMENILDNAADALAGCPANAGWVPTITVSTHKTPRGVDIVVADNGPGIADDVIERLRQPLFTTKGFGAGLGLPAVEQTMVRHDGGLDVASVPGGGARFTLWLPLEAKKKTAA